MIRLGTHNTALGHWRGRWIQELAGDITLVALPGESDLTLALLTGEVEAVVLDAATLPITETPGTALVAVCQRGDIRDAVVSKTGQALTQLPAGTHVGSRDSVRLLQLNALYPELVWVELTRDTEAQLQAIEEGLVDAVVVSYADLSRLGLVEAPSEILPPETCLPPLGQGSTVLQCRTGDDETATRLREACNHFESQRELAGEILFRQAWYGRHPEPITACALASDRFLYLFTLVQTATGELRRTRTSSHPSELPSLVWEAVGNVESLLTNP